MKRTPNGEGGLPMRLSLCIGLAAVCLACMTCQTPDTAGDSAAAASDAALTASACPVQGTWILESVARDGQPQDLGTWSQIKLVTSTHVAWVGQETGVMPLVTEVDSLAAFRTRGFGGGTYQVTDSTYAERIDYFFNPQYLGREITSSCRIEDGRWYHGFDWPLMSAGQDTGSVHLDEVWRPIQ